MSVRSDTASAILDALSDVFQAGADKARSWPYNVTDQHAAEVYQAMADEAVRQSERLYRVDDD